MQIQEIVDYCEELVPKWQGEMKSGSSRHVGIKCEGRSAPLRQRKEDVDWRRTKKTNGQALPQTIELINDLDELILNHNPWSALSEKLKRRVGQSWDTGFSFAADARFALDDDVEKIKEYNDKILRKIEKTSDAKKRKEYEKLLLKVNEQQPIPFIGHPEAKVWVLAMNPAYNPLEWCTFIDCYDDKSENLINSQQGARELPELRMCFKERQMLYAKSLSFSNDESKRFYVLDASMNVFERSGKKDWSGYIWYGRHYLPDKNAYFQGGDKLVIASKELFALEYLPYPSTAFGDNYPVFQHTTFWAKLVKFALHNDKILIVRGRIMELVRGVDPEKFEEARKAGRILKFLNPQQISITRDNVVEYGARKLEEYCGKIEK